MKLAYNLLRNSVHRQAERQTNIKIDESDFITSLADVLR